MSHKVKIFVSHHKPYWICKNDIYEPIQVGRSISSTKLDMIGDDTGENISKKNQYYCELTAMYWVWKNYTHIDFVGFCHYRRYFNFNDSFSKINPISESYKSKLRKLKFLNLYRWNNRSAITMESSTIADNFKSLSNYNDEFNKLISLYDIILPERLKIGKVTLEKQYGIKHSNEDWDILINTVRLKYPHFDKYVNLTIKKRTLYAYNMFVMKRELFLSYMNWLFDILFSVENKIIIKDDPYQCRALGFMAERLFNIYIEYLKREKGITFKEVEVVTT